MDKNHLKIVAPPKDPKSKAWQDKIRVHARELSTSLETGYMDLARVLYEVYNTPVDGDPKKPALYQGWGYKTFAEYAETELGLHRRKAERLRAIWYRLAVEMEAMPDDLRDRIVRLGWSKVRELVRVLTLRNAAEWVERAEDASYPELCEAIQKYILLKEKKAKEKQEAEHLGPADDLPTPEDGGWGSGPVSQASPVSIPEVDDEELPVPVVEEMKWKHFGLFPEQYDLVQQGIERASQIAGSDKPGHLLTLIVTDFLATNDFTGNNTESFMKYIHKYEKLWNTDLIAVDRETGEIVYGLTTLKKLAEES